LKSGSATNFIVASNINGMVIEMHPQFRK